MSCCGRKRAEWLQNERAGTGAAAPRASDPPPSAVEAPRAFEYTGRGSRLLKGVHSGRSYHFRHCGEIVEVDYGDHFALLAEADLRLVRRR